MVGLNGDHVYPEGFGAQRRQYYIMNFGLPFTVGDYDVLDRSSL